MRNALLIESMELGAQLRQVLSYLGREPDPSSCSHAVRVQFRTGAGDTRLSSHLVPPYVFETQTDFRRCPGCGRIYWGGTHREHIRSRLEKLLKSS